MKRNGYHEKQPRGPMAIRALTAAAGALLTLTTGWLCLLPAGDGLTNLSYDLPFVVHRAGEADDICIVYVDDRNGDVLDRSVQAPLVDALADAGARAVVYDIFFDRPSADPAVDLAFAAALRRFRGVDENDEAVPGRQRRLVMMACLRESEESTGNVIERLTPPTDEIAAAADEFGVVVLRNDADLTVRRLATGTRLEPSVLWHMASALGHPPKGERTDERWINYAGPPVNASDVKAEPPIRTFDAASVIKGMATGLLRDKVVIVGGRSEAKGRVMSVDRFATPFHRLDFGRKMEFMTGTEIQANVLANLLHGNWLTRCGRGFELFMIVSVALLAGAGFSWIRPARAVAAGLSGVVVLAVLGTLAVHFGNRWFPWSVAAFAQIPVAMVWGAASHFQVERYFRLKGDEQKRQLGELFGKYLSPQMLKQMENQGYNVQLGGSIVKVAMMFTDIESFSGMSERVRKPERIVQTLNDYFSRTTGHIYDHNGVIIQFIGDAIFAAWGAPLPDEEAPLNAVRAAWKLFESDKLVVDGQEMRTRFGLHFDQVVAGNIGSERHMCYTLVGDAVNLASRLEGINKMLETSILMSGELRAEIGDGFRTRRVGKFRVLGREEVTEVHELLGPVRQEDEPGWVTLYHEAVSTLEAGDRAKAQSLFEAVGPRRGPKGDGPSAFFLKRLAKGDPLPDGIVELSEK